LLLAASCERAAPRLIPDGGFAVFGPTTYVGCTSADLGACCSSTDGCYLNLADEERAICSLYPPHGFPHAAVTSVAGGTLVDVSGADYTWRWVYNATGELVAILRANYNTMVVHCCAGLPGFDPTTALSVAAYQDFSGDAYQTRCASVAPDAGGD
jgi:hypothetical protein